MAVTPGVVESWLVGVSASGGRLASLRVHAGYVAAGPATGFGQRVHVRIRLQHPTESGFAGPDELQVLAEVEGRLTLGVEEVAVVVASLGTAGFRDLILYTRDAEAFYAAMASCVLVDLGYEPEVDSDADPSWSTYRALFTEAVDADADRRILARASAAGCDLGSPRELTHFAAFAHLDDATSMVEALRAQDIDAVVRADPLPAAVAAEAGLRRTDSLDGRHVVSVREEAVLSQVHIAWERAELTALSSSWGGDYLGWTIDGVDLAAAAPAP